MTPEVAKVLDELPADFFGTVEIGYQNGHPGVVRVTQTHRLNASNTSREPRGNQNVQRANDDR